MFKLIKWIGISTVGLGAVSYFMFGGHALSYVSTAASSIRDGISKSIPIEFELKRAAKLVKDIEPQVRKGHRQLVQAEVELEKLQRDVAFLSESVQISEKGLKTATAALSLETTVGYQLADWKGRDRIEYRLERTFEKHKNNVEMLKSKKALIVRQGRVVTAAREHLEAIKKQKNYLEDMIADLKTQKAQLDTLQASSKSINFDDPESALGQAKETLAKIKERLDVSQRCLEEELFFETSAEKLPTNRDVAAEIRYYFDAHAQESQSQHVPVKTGKRLSQVR